jgi:hypothetical protein
VARGGAVSGGVTRGGAVSGGVTRGGAVNGGVTRGGAVSGGVTGGRRSAPCNIEAPRGAVYSKYTYSYTLLPRMCGKVRVKCDEMRCGAVMRPDVNQDAHNVETMTGTMCIAM